MIVAIEPDRRRAAQLTTMARAHLRDELVVAATAAQAVDALNGRVPDVLLTAPLLPSQEETAIADYLRHLGSAAAHVQTLTIPLLASTAGERDRPVLSAFLRGRSQYVEPEGCDPAVFAEQITEYLREARERKVVVPTVVPNAAIDDVESTAASNAPEPSVASVTVDDARPSYAGRRFKELLARLDVSELDEPAFDLQVSHPPSRGMHGTATIEADTVTVTPEIIDATFEGDIPTIDVAPVTSAIALPAPSATATPSGVETSGFGHTSHREDDWSLFDPGKYGFPALIAKLDEIASRDGDS